MSEQRNRIKNLIDELPDSALDKLEAGLLGYDKPEPLVKAKSFEVIMNPMVRSAFSFSISPHEIEWITDD